MARNYRQSDYAKNKYSSNIVYAGSDETIEITLEQFLKENPSMTEEDFLYWKNWSDEDYLEQIIRETNIKKHEFLFNDSDETELFWIPSAEDVVIEKLHRENKRMYTMEDAEAVLSKLTDIQRRRYLLYEVYGLSTPQIALSEGVSQYTVWESIDAAKKRIKKFLRNF